MWQLLSGRTTLNAARVPWALAATIKALVRHLSHDMHTLITIFCCTQPGRQIDDEAEATVHAREFNAISYAIQFQICSSEEDENERS
jgi:hypothetical protein